MATPSLPASFRLSDPVDSIPAGAFSSLITVRPSSGSGPYKGGAVVDFDIPSRGWLDPKSLAIRYTATIATPAAAAGAAQYTAMCGTPVYTPFQRVQVTCNNAVLDTISQANQVYHVITQGNLDVASKFGRQTAYAYSGGLGATLALQGAATTIQNLDGRLTYIAGGAGANAAGDVYTASAPLPCILSNCSKMLPVFAMGALRLTISLDTIANMFYPACAANGTAAAVIITTPTDFTITNFELCYNMMDMGKDVEQMVKGMGPRVFLKSFSYSNSATNIAANVTGSNSYVFNQRLASIKTAFILPTLSIGNKSFEICDITSKTGQYSLTIGNLSFPSQPLSSLNNRASILQETFRAFKNIYENGSMSIDSTEFNILGTSVAADLSPYSPGKHIVGLSLNRVQNSDNTVMSGVSTFDSAISVNIDNTTANAVACGLNLLLEYDAVIVVDLESKQVSVRS